MKYVSGLVCLVFFLSSCKKESIDQKRVRTFNITSSINQATYEIKVALPEQYAPGKTYHVLYVLDAKWDFDFVAAACNKQAKAVNKDEVLVVGINWGRNRLIDYSPVPIKGYKGEADLFARFIRDELMPRIGADFQATTGRNSRAIIGHSAGGLFAAHCFTNYNDLFGNYLMLSPSVWAGDQIVLINEKRNREQTKITTGNLFLALGELEEQLMAAPIEAFRRVLITYYTGYQLKYNRAAGLDHLGSKETNIRKAITFYFDQL
jgi:predicted alpha/beta superfamily hydrolase